MAECPFVLLNIQGVPRYSRGWYFGAVMSSAVQKQQQLCLPPCTQPVKSDMECSLPAGPKPDKSDKTDLCEQVGFQMQNICSSCKKYDCTLTAALDSSVWPYKAGTPEFDLGDRIKSSVQAALLPQKLPVRVLSATPSLELALEK